MTPIKDLLKLLAEYGGNIISSNDLSPDWIEQARVSGRMFVDDNGLGFIWEPPDDLACTEEGVALFEKWYPIEMPLPDSLNDTSFLFKKRVNPKDN